MSDLKLVLPKKESLICELRSMKDPQEGQDKFYFIFEEVGGKHQVVHRYCDSKDGIVGNLYSLRVEHRIDGVTQYQKKGNEEIFFHESTDIIAPPYELVPYNPMRTQVEKSQLELELLKRKLQAAELTA